MAALVIGSLPKQVQTNELFRLDLSRTTVHVGDNAIQTLEVTANGETFDVRTEKYLDFMYETTGEKTISVYAECGGQGHPAVTKEFTINVVSPSDENLFCTDSELLQIEPDLMKMLPDGRASYHYVHRLVQDRILAEIDEKGFVNSEGDKLDAADFVDVSEVNEWAKYYALMYIMQSLSNSVEDIFNQKYERYEEFMKQCRNRAIIRYDHDGDGTIEDGEAINMNYARLVKR